MLMTVQSQMFQKRPRLNFNRDVNARRQVQFLQFVHCLRGWLDDVEQYAEPGLGETLRRLPWSSANAGSDRLIASVERFEGLAEIKKDQWPVR